MIRYLSLDWINALSDEVAASDHMREIAESHRIGVTQVVSNGPEGDVTYHLSVGDGDASFGAGPADPEDVKMEQDWDDRRRRRHRRTQRAGGLHQRTDPTVRRPAEAARFAACVRSARLDLLVGARAHRRTTEDAPLAMPEMPEIQAHAERLTEQFSGRVLTGFTTVQLHGTQDGGTASIGCLRTAAARRRPPRQVSVAAVRADQLRRASDAGRSAGPRHEALGQTSWRAGTVRVRADRARRRIDRRDRAAPHRAGQGTPRRRLVSAAADGRSTSPPLDKLGPEAATITDDELAALFAANSMRVHGFLRDQRMIAGIGRRLANEICHRARVSPFANTRKLGADGAAVVAAAIRSCIDRGARVRARRVTT